MRFGIVLFTSDRGITPARAARAAEEHGFASFWVPEHTHIPTSRDTLHPGTGTAELPDDRYTRTLDPWACLASAATVTTRIRLGTAVALPFEHDAISLAKTIATVDVLSAGRVVLGAGFGWNAEEMADHGVPPARRRTVLNEYIDAMRSLWTEEVPSYEGEFVRFGPCWAWPKPLQQPLPVLIGAAGTERTFSWVVRCADGWITTPGEADPISSVGLLRQRWREAGRDGDPEIVILGARPDQKEVAAWEEAGVSEVMIGLPDRSEDEVLSYIERRADMVRAFA